MKTIYMIWYKSEYSEGLCFNGRDPFWTTDYNNAVDYKRELEENTKSWGESATFNVVRFEVKE